MRLILWIFSVLFVGFNIVKYLALMEAASILGYLAALPVNVLGTIMAVVILIAGYAMCLDVLEAQKW